MKTERSLASKYHIYKDFYTRVIEDIKVGDCHKEKELKKDLLESFEVTTKGKELVIEGNLL